MDRNIGKTREECFLSTVVNRVEEINSLLSSAVSRLTNLGDRTFGIEPADPCGEAQAKPNGIAQEINNLFDQTNALGLALNQQIERISKL